MLISVHTTLNGVVHGSVWGSLASHSVVYHTYFSQCSYNHNYHSRNHYKYGVIWKLRLYINTEPSTL